MQMDEEMKSVHTFRATSIDLNGAGMEAVMTEKLFKDCEIFDTFITGGGMYMLFADNDSNKIRYEWKFSLKSIIDMNNKKHKMYYVIYYLYPAEGADGFYFCTTPDEW